MKITYQSCDLDGYAIYDHTRGESVSLKDIDNGALFSPAEIVCYTDVNSKGEEKEICSVITAEGTHVTTDSPYFREELLHIASLAEQGLIDKQYTVRVVKQISKGGRTFTTCALVRPEK